MHPDASPPVTAPDNRGTRRLGRTALALLAFVMALALAACGSSTTNASSSTDSLANETGPKGDAAWQKLVKDAKAEGEVVFYTSHGEDTMTKLATAFEKKYGIKVTIFRAPDNDLEPKLDAEEKTGNHVADIVALSDLAYVKKMSRGPVSWRSRRDRPWTPTGSTARRTPRRPTRSGPRVRP